MWLFSQNSQILSRHAIILVGITLCVLFLTACSEMNVRQLGRDNQEQLKKIAVVDINTRTGQLFGRELRKLLHIGGKSNEAYKLISKTSTSSSGTISVQGMASSLNKMSMTASFQLNDIKTGKTLFTDEVSGDATLGAVTSLYGQEKSETHARERLAILLAQRVVRRLQLYFLNQND